MPSPGTGHQAAGAEDGHGEGRPGHRHLRPVPARPVSRRVSTRGRCAAEAGPPRPSGATPRVGDVADPSTYRPRPGEIPVEPGVYRFRDAHGRVIYVGKAKSLRSRLSSYFQDISALHPRTRTMVTTGAQRRVDRRRPTRSRRCSWSTPGSRSSTPGSTSSTATTSPTPTSRSRWARSSRASQVHARGQAQGHPLLRPVRPRLGDPRDASTCCCGSSRCAPAAPGSSSGPGQIGRPCLLGYIDKCSAPCVGRVDADEHRAHRRGLLRLHGRQHRPVRPAARARDERRPPAELDFERAARLRDDIGALEPGAGEERRRARATRTDADVFALAEDELEAAVQVFHVRGGRVRGQRGWVVEKVEDRGHRRAGRAPAPAGVRRRVRRRRAARGARARAARGRRATRRRGSAGCAARGSTCGCRSAGTSAR